MNNLTVEEHQYVRNAKRIDESEQLLDIIERLDRELTAKVEHCKRIEDELTVLADTNSELAGMVAELSGDEL